MAPLWVSYTANLGTLLRTCDAVGACMAVPSSPHYRRALQQGDTLGHRHRPHIHWATPNRDRWVEGMAAYGWTIVAVEVSEDAVPLPRVLPTRQPTVVLLGHEHEGVPDAWVAKADQRVTIPMTGVGASLNVAVAGSLVLYRLAGLA
ncbi:MAG TPA: TrmH family RNA methyltransferase [Acidimicrobiales bacterium]|nr:TrmH family RNA methyltransferase [Acidimicrobiales bacterium]